MGVLDTSGVLGPKTSHEKGDNVVLDDPTPDENFNSSLQEKHGQLQERHISFLSKNLATCEEDYKHLKLQNAELEMKNRELDMLLIEVKERNMEYCLQLHER